MCAWEWIYGWRWRSCIIIDDRWRLYWHLTDLYWSWWKANRHNWMGMGPFGPLDSLNSIRQNQHLWPSDLTDDWSVKISHATLMRRTCPEMLFHFHPVLDILVGHFILRILTWICLHDSCMVWRVSRDYSSSCQRKVTVVWDYMKIQEFSMQIFRIRGLSASVRRIAVPGPTHQPNQ